jgi:hypothetical protein
MLSPVVTNKMYHATYGNITSVFDNLGDVVDQIDSRKPKGHQVKNTRELFPLADRFVRNTTEATNTILDCYVDYINSGSASGEDHARIIENEGLRIFREVKDIAQQAQRLETRTRSGGIERVDQPHFQELDAISSDTNEAATSHHKALFHPQSGAKRGAVQTALFSEARRLGPEYGSNFLLSVEDTFLACVGMLQSMREIGIPVNLGIFPGIDARFENYGFNQPAQHTAQINKARQNLAEQKIQAVRDIVLSLTHVMNDSSITRNPEEQRAMVERFTQHVNASLDSIQGSLAAHLSKPERAEKNTARTIEREGLKIFKEIEHIVAASKAIRPEGSGDFKPLASLRHAKDTPKEASEQELFQLLNDKKRFYNALRTKRAKIQDAVCEQADRLGEHHGGRTMLKVEDGILATVDMLRAVKAAGAGIDMNVFPDKEARFEWYRMQPPEDHTAFHAAVEGPKEVLEEKEPIIDTNLTRITRNNN